VNDFDKYGGSLNFFRSVLH